MDACVCVYAGENRTRKCACSSFTDDVERKVDGSTHVIKLAFLSLHVERIE